MKTGKTVVVLHGWAQSAHNQAKWQPFLDALAEAGYDAHFLGLPGLSTPLEAPWQLADYVSWLYRQIKSITPDGNVILVGHSFGGQLAVRFTATHRDMIASLVLIDSAGLRDTRLIKRIKRSVFWVLAKLGRVFTAVPWARSTLYKLARERDYFEATPVMRQTMQQVLSDQIIEDLHEIQVPTLILWGENDQATPLYLGNCIHAGIAGSQLRIITGARHSPQFTHTAHVVREITHFLRKQEEAS